MTSAVARTHSKTRAGSAAAAAAASSNCCLLTHISSSVSAHSTHAQQQPKQQQQQQGNEHEERSAPAVLHSCSPQAHCGLATAFHFSQVGGRTPQHPLSSALPMCPFSCESGASTAQGPCLDRQDSVSMAKAIQQKREQHTPAQHVSHRLILDRLGPATNQSNAFHMAKPGCSLPRGADPKHEYACSAVPRDRMLSLTGLQYDIDKSVHPGLCCFAPCPPESNNSQTSQFDQNLALPDSMALTDTPARSLPDPPEAPTGLEPGGFSDIDNQQQHPALDFPACLQPPHRPLTVSQLYSCGHGESATVLRHQHQLHMIDLMLARVTAAEEAMQQGISVDAQHVPYLTGGFSTAVSAQQPLAGVKCVLADDCFPACVVPITRPEQPFVNAGLSHHDLLSSLASTEITNSLYDHLNDVTAQAQTDIEESDLGSVVDCPGSGLVPNDWLTDECEGPDLPCLVSVVHLGKPVCTSLPLMPPSLRDCSNTHAARRLL